MITYIYMGICIALFIYIYRSGDSMRTAVKLGALYIPKVKYDHEWWRLLTCNFIHAEPLHLFMNMYCIFYLGRYFETLLGPLPYLGLLLAGMLGSGGVTYWWSTGPRGNERSITLGASGVFYAFLGAIVALGLFQGGYFMYLLQSYMYCIVINLAFTLLNPGISKTGHIGGLLFGYLYIYILHLL